tara:strand:+ start:950 stop:1117 length:168 start_codon:yes stop_codon:yes gene_type:complete
MAKYSPYKMKGHSLPGPNQSKSSKKKSPGKWIQAVAALAPMVMDMMKSKNKKEEE